MGKKTPDYSAYTDRNTQRALAAACRARKLSSCGSKLQLARRLSASGVPPQLVQKVANEPDWRESYKHEKGSGKKETLTERKVSVEGDFEIARPSLFDIQTAGEDDETQPPILDSQYLIPETPRSNMHPPFKRFESQTGVSSTMKSPSSGHKREPRFTVDEQVRLAHVMADPKMSFTLTKMYNRPERRAEIDDRQEDPWDGIISGMFNSEEVVYARPGAVGGTLTALLENFDPNNHPCFRSGAMLKAKWAKMRSMFTVVYSRWSASGQNDPESFPRFVSDGKSVLCYLFCVFYNLPSLSFVVRTLPAEASVEEGVGMRVPPKKKRKLQKRNEADEALLCMARKISEAADRVGSEQGVDEDARRKISESKVINEQASAFRNLMMLEKEISEALREFPDDSEKKHALEYVREKMRAIF